MKSNDCFHDLLHYIKAKQNKTEAKSYTLIVSSLSRRLHATVALHMYYHQSMFKYWLIDMHKYIHTHVYFFKSSQFSTTKLCDHFFVSFISYVFTFCAMNTCIMLQNILDIWRLNRCSCTFWEGAKQENELHDCSLNVNCFHEMRIVPGKRMKNCDSWYKSVISPVNMIFRSQF